MRFASPRVVALFKSLFNFLQVFFKLFKQGGQLVHAKRQRKSKVGHAKALGK